MARKESLEQLSIIRQGLRYKLLISFTLMSVIPLLTLGYFISSVVIVHIQLSFIESSFVILFCIILAWAGLFLAKDIIERIIRVHSESTIMGEGNYKRSIPVHPGDEVDQIGENINKLVGRIRDTIGDLTTCQLNIRETGKREKRERVITKGKHDSRCQEDTAGNAGEECLRSARDGEFTAPPADRRKTDPA